MKAKFSRILTGVAILFFGAVVLLLLVFRYYGLPEHVAQRITQELQSHGLTIHIDHLYLDPSGGVVAQNLTLTETQNNVTETEQIERVRFRFNWVSWWRGEPFLEGISISHGRVVMALDRETTLELREVNADIGLRPNRLDIHYLNAELLNARLQVSGVVDLTGLSSKKSAPPPNLEKYAKVYRQIQTGAADWSSLKPLVIDVQLKAVALDPSKSTVQVRIRGHEHLWRGVLAEEIALEADYDAGQVQLHGEVQFLRGHFQLDGHWKNGDRKALVTYYSDVDLTLLADAFPGRVREFMGDVRFYEAPVNEGRLEMDWTDGFHFLLLNRSDWRGFSIRDTRFESLYLPISYDGRRFMISDMTVKTARGEASFNFFYDGAQTLKAHLSSGLDPTVIKKLLGEGAQPFFDSLEFDVPPQIDCEIRGSGLSPDLVTVTGTVAVRDFSYKRVPLTELKTAFDFKDSELHLAGLHIKRPEGEGQGEVWHNLKTRQVRLKDVRGTLNLRETATIIGNKMAEYAQPYNFLQAPTFAVDGQVDLDKQQGTDLKVHLVSKAGLKYVFLKKLLTLTDVDVDLAIKGKKLTLLPRKPVTLFSGQLMGKLAVSLVEKPDYEATATLTDENFGDLMKTFFGNDDIKGSVSADMKLKGRFDDLSTMYGTGDVNVNNGVLYNIPVFGTLSQVLNSIIPNLGYSEARRAKAVFQVRDGVIDISNMDVASSGFALIGSGRYDMIKDSVDMNMRVNVRGIVGLVFFPMSKLFEYEGKGTMADTKWTPKIF